MLVLSARCSSEIPLDRAEQSSTFGGNIAAYAIDNNLTTYSRTTREDPAWLRVYFNSSTTVERMVVEKGQVTNAEACMLTVSVYDGEIETVCETYNHRLVKVL